MFKKTKIVLIGASTGGPGHIKKILPHLKSANVIYIIAQHMHHLYMSSFTAQLNSLSTLPVLQSEQESILELDTVYICTNNTLLSYKKSTLLLTSIQKETPYEPSIDLLFQSATALIPQYDIISIVLTGIGDDGAKSSLDLHKAGAVTIAESQESAIVYGMPKQAYEYNKQTKVMSLDAIINYLKDL